MYFGNHKINGVNQPELITYPELRQINCVFPGAHPKREWLINWGSHQPSNGGEGGGGHLL